MSNDPAATGPNLVSRLLAPLALALTLLAPATAAAALAPQGGKLTVAGSHQLGQAVALSADGTLALAGAPTDGAVRVLARSGGTWADTGAPLLPAAGPDATGFGGAVALSADGLVALVGAPGADDGAGAAWLFVRSGATWTQAGRLTGIGEDGDGQFGVAVALSADGAVAVVSAPLDANGAGAVWVFVRSGSSWLPRGPKLLATGTSGTPLLGRSVAVSG